MNKIRHSMNLTGAIVATAVGVLLPVILSTSVGIVAIAMGRSTEWTLFGVLVISFAAAAIGGGIVVTVLLSKKHRIARLQADFLANVTHDLRTPLTAIRLYIETLTSGKINDRPDLIESSLNTILQETKWLEAMIDRVLTWRAASKDMDFFELQLGNLGVAVKSAVDRFKSMVAWEDLVFKYHVFSEKEVYFSPREIESIVINLLVNAYKYTPKNKKIELYLEDQEDFVLLTIKDNGIGISKPEQSKIFDPFFRVDSKLSGKASGAGLGLAIVKHHVDIHKARITVVSEPEKGSEFKILFPVAKV